MIICAALLIKPKNPTIPEFIIGGHRHGEIYDELRKMEQMLGVKFDGYEKITEGFLDHIGKFYTRSGGLRHAANCGQLSKTTLLYKQEHEIDELDSEDLY